MRAFYFILAVFSFSTAIAQEQENYEKGKEKTAQKTNKDLPLNTRILNDKQLTNRRTKRQVYAHSRKWENNTVFYYFDSSINERKKKSIYSGEGCSSFHGMLGGEQNLSLGDGCEFKGIILHEIAHTLGLIHTQQRSDRDDYVEINLTSVDDDYKYENDKMATEIYTPYEYGSMMHYPADMFELKGSEALIPKDPRYLYTMGGHQMSFYDIQAINRYYECDNPLLSSKHSSENDSSTSVRDGCAQCKNGGLPSVRNCMICDCPDGYGGKFCDERPQICGQILNASSEWKTHSLSVGSYNQIITQDDFHRCVSWITAPEGKEIEVKLMEMYNPRCGYGCIFNGIEVKGDKDPRITNPRYCCNKFIGSVVTSVQNPTPIITYARAWYTTFIIAYRYVDAASTTSVPPPPCRNRGSMCSDFYCNSPWISFRDKKFYCGETCGLCEETSPICEDTVQCSDLLNNRSCKELLLNEFHEDEGYMENHCAETCGICVNRTNSLSSKTTTVAWNSSTTTTASSLNRSEATTESRQLLE